MGMVQSPGHLVKIMVHGGQVHRPAQQILQGATGDMFHNKIAEVTLNANVVNRQNVRMAELGDGPGFEEESFGEPGGKRMLGRQDLDSHVTIQAGLVGFVYRGHPARTN